MDWTDERYVRLYTRDAGGWASWAWQARALFPLLLRASDRAGIIDMTDRLDLADRLRVPLDFLACGLDGADGRRGLLADGCIEQPDPQHLVIRNFCKAQEAPQSDRARQAESRARRRDLARAGALPVTNRDEASRNVTKSHDLSLCTEPICTETEEDLARASARPTVQPNLPHLQPTPAASAPSSSSSPPPRSRKPSSSSKPRREPLPFRAAAAVAAVADASNGRFIPPLELSSGHAIRLERLIRLAPKLDDWSLFGSWLAAGAESWRGLVDIGFLAAKFGDLHPQAKKWNTDGRPVIGTNGAPASKTPPSPRSNVPDAAETERRRLARERGAR